MCSSAGASVPAPPGTSGSNIHGSPITFAAVVALSDGTVATSGRAERGDHVLDPRTGAAATGLVSATVIGPDLANADTLATAAIAYGGIDADWLAPRGIAVMGITDDRIVVTSREFDAYLAS